MNITLIALIVAIVFLLIIGITFAETIYCLARKLICTLLQILLLIVKVLTFPFVQIHKHIQTKKLN